MKYVFWGLCWVVLVACGGGNGGNTTISSVKTTPDFIIMKDEGLAIKTSSVEGDGEIALEKPLNTSGANFKLDFDLFENGSSITVLIFSDSKLDESSAVVIKIERVGTELSGTFTIAGSNPIGFALGSLTTSGKTLYVDVHNDEEPSHVIIWDDTTTSFSEDNALFNSEEDDSLGVLGQKVGAGKFVGVKLLNASLKGLSIDTPKFGH